MRKNTNLDPDSTAAEIYQRAGADLYDPPGAAELVRRILGDDAIVVTSGLASAAEYRPERRVICVRRRLDPIELAFMSCHELVEWYCTEIGYDRPNREWICNRTAARLLAPAEAMRASRHLIAQTPEAIGAYFGVSHTVAALRIGETSGRSLVVVDPAWLMAAGDAYGWPPEHTLRDIAACRIVVPEIERHALPDAPRRSLLVAA